MILSPRSGPGGRVERQAYNEAVGERQCYHCKQMVTDGDGHDCWTTTEAALTRDLPEDLQDAWERLRETAAAFGEQRIYASHKSIMFSRKSCYFFVRPKRDYLEVCVFLGRTLIAPQVRRVDRASKSKSVHIMHIRHRDEVEQSKYAFGQVDMPKAEFNRIHRELFEQYYVLGQTLLRSDLVLPQQGPV